MPEEEPEGLTEYERWQIAMALVGLGASLIFTAWIMFRDDASLIGKAKWWREQQRRKREFEAEVRRDLNHVLFQAWEVMNAPAV